MARVASVFLLCLLALAAAAPDYSQDEDAYAAAEAQAQAQAEDWSPEEAQGQLRGGEEAQPWNDDEYAYEEQDADAPLQQGYQLRDRSEQQTQQVQEPQERTDEGTLDRLRDETQRDQQEQQTGALQQDQQWGQQSGQLTQEQSGRLQDQPQPGDRPAPGDRPQIFPPTKPEADFGLDKPGASPPQASPPQASPPQASPPRGFAPPSRPPIRQPPNGYTKVQTFGFFKVFEKPLTWSEALVTCWQDGAQLAVPSSIAEASAVGELYGRIKTKVQKSQDKELFFIGASDLAKEGDFVTVWGTKFNAGQWHRWTKGEPNNHKKIEHCVLSNDKGFYWDGNCQAKFAFICQFKDPCQSSPRFDNLQQSEQQQQQSRY